jgi:polar amino acid transport system substrate-binding protein
VDRSRNTWILCGALLVSLVLAGCASPDSASPATERPGALTRIVESGVIRVGMTGEQPPLTMISRDGEFLGLDVALMRVLARSMGVEARFVPIDFENLLDALDADEIDVVMSGMTITARRVERATFIGPYFTSGKTLLTRSPELAAVEIPQDLDKPELRFAALRGSTSEEFARSSLSNAELVLTAGLDQAVQKVVSGEVDALIADRETCFFAVLRFPDRGLIASPATFTIEPMGIAVPLDEPRLANLLRTYFTALSETGAIERAHAVWFKDPSWVKSLR